MKRLILFALAGVALGTGAALGQLPPIQLPQASPEASRTGRPAPTSIPFPARVMPSFR